MTSWGNQKKSANISGRDLWSSMFLVHPLVQYLDAWRCHVLLFKQLYGSINTMGMSIHHTAQERDGSKSQRWTCFYQNVRINPWTKVKHLVKRVTEAGKRVSSTVKPVLYQHELKGCSSEEEPMTPWATSKSQITMCKCTQEQRPSSLETCPVVWWN